MPTARIELGRSTPAYEVVSIVSDPLSWRAYPLAYPEFPRGLSDFGAAWAARSEYCVTLELRRDASGTDWTPVLVAADYLRERGWEVELPSWVR